MHTIVKQLCDTGVAEAVERQAVRLVQNAIVAEFAQKFATVVQHLRKIAQQRATATTATNRKGYLYSVIFPICNVEFASTAHKATRLAKQSVGTTVASESCQAAAVKLEHLYFVTRCYKHKSSSAVRSDEARTS